MRIAPLAFRCRKSFTRVIQARGEDYFHQKLATVLKVSATEAELEVEGAEIYRVRLSWRETARKGDVSASCTCPSFGGGDNCKHLWAAILKLDQQGVGSRVPSGPEFASLTVNGRVMVEEGGRDGGSAGGPGGAGRRNLEREWLRNIEEVIAEGRKDLPVSAGPRGPVSGQAIPPRRNPRVACFRLDLDGTRVSGQISLVFCFRERAAGASVGPMKQEKLARADLLLYEDPADRELLLTLIRLAETSSGSNLHFRDVKLPPELQVELLQEISKKGRLFGPRGAPMRLDSEGGPWRLSLEVGDPSKKTYEVRGFFTRGPHERLEIFAPLICLRSGLLVFEDRIASIECRGQFGWISHLRKHTEIVVPKTDLDQLVETLARDPAAPPVAWPSEGFGWEVLQPAPEPKILVGTSYLHTSERYSRGVRVQLLFGYAGRWFSEDEAASFHADTVHRRILQRDPSAEGALRERLREVGGLGVDGSLPVERLPELVSQAAAWGWPVEAFGKKVRSAGDFEIRVASGVDWFDLNAGAVFEGGTTLALPRLLQAARSGETLIQLGDGTVGLLPSEWLRKFAAISEMGGSETADGGSLRFKKAQGLMLALWLADEAGLKGDAGFDSLRASIKRFDAIKSRKPPRTFRGELRPYQEEGLGWLEVLRETGVGGILADDMGLGKTVQVLALLEQERMRARSGERAQQPGETAAPLPSIVILPKSLLLNWQEEAERFAPKLKVLCHAGTHRARTREALKKADLILVTYTTLRKDLEIFRSLEFQYAIADEAQAIKNPDSQAHVACRLLKARHRLALTGTPVENSLGDLFAIFNFVNPGLLGRTTRSRMVSAAAPAGATDEPETLERLARALRPFILRRTKEQVLRDLPEKSEQVLHCELSSGERRMYNELRDFYRANLKGEIDAHGLARSKIVVLEALLRLRQAACHPGLVDKKQTGFDSAKTELLVEQLKELAAEGHQSLVFSQFTSFLDIVQAKLEAQGIAFERLDGSTSVENRQAAIARFRDDPTRRVFLISLKAGGVGLNLTAADYVFILDPWWNPAVEAQAVSRAHRIGQTKKVIAYRLIAKNTVEEKILELQKSKRDLADAIIQADASLIRGLTEQDLEMLLS